MSKLVIKDLFLCFNILPRLGTTVIFSIYCSDIDQLPNLLEENKQCRITLVCKAEDTQKLNDIMIQRCIHGIYIFGHCPELKIPNKEITIINTNEQDLMFQILCAAVQYTHDEEMMQRKLGNYNFADLLAMDTLKLLDQIKALL
jgi:NADH/NAD ratio-sensing transcriptional regulator Rex